MHRKNSQDPIFKKRRYAHIEDVIVAQAYRGEGIGRILMDTARKWAESQNATAVDLWVWEDNNDAIGFYKHLGYETVRQVMQLQLGTE